MKASYLKSSHIFLFLLFLLISTFVFRDLILNTRTNLLDFRDYGLINWIIYQNIRNVLSFNFQTFFNSTAFYPNPYTLLFADSFLPQALIVIPFFLVSKNLVFSFNILFILTWVLNYFSVYLFWNKIFRNSLVAFFGSILLLFSPIFHLNLSHFQVLSFWPFFFCWYFVLKNDSDNKGIYLSLAGLFLAVQFLSGVYLSVFLIFSLFIFYFCKAVLSKKIFKSFKSFSTIMVVFLLLDAVFIKGYFDMKNYYQFKREYGEFVNYSASTTDYFFSTPINSAVHQSGLMKAWNKYDLNKGARAAFPGFLIFSLAVVGFYYLIKKRRDPKTGSIPTYLLAGFGTFILCGIIFSFGPKLKINGEFIDFTLPYSLLMKINPALEVVRVNARWSFLFYLGMIFFALYGVSKFQNHKKFKTIVGILLLVCLLEYAPLNLKTSSEEYINSNYELLRDECLKEKKVVLEIPVTHLTAGDNIVYGVTYIGKVMMSSTYHNCYLFNGYSGYDLPSITQLSEKINLAIDNGNTDEFVNLMKENKIDLIKFNPDAFPNSRQKSLQQFFNNLEKNTDIKQVDGILYSINY